jgi:hypothetical protein
LPLLDRSLQCLALVEGTHEHAPRPEPSHVVGQYLSNERSTMRKLVVALVAGAIGVGALVSPAAAQPTDVPGEPSCQAGVITQAVKVGHGRREAAEAFFGDNPKAVQTAERAVRAFCAGS